MPPHFLPATAERSAPGELIPGTSRLVHLEENMKIADVTLSDDDIAELEKSI
jgi:aryl-alcohol dehydrogenase-like predicted oxidoreductase